MTGVWMETFVKIDRCWNCKQHRYVLDQFVEKALPALKKIEKSRTVEKLCWLIHDRQSGVPYGREGSWFHIRAKLIDGANPEKFKKALTRKCEMTREVEEFAMDEIAGVNLENFIGGAEDAWDLICIQSNWVTRFIVKQKYVAAPQQCRQFLHYFANMLQQAAS